MKYVYRFIVYGFTYLLLFVVIVNVGIYFETRPTIYKNSAEVPNAEVALIPGAAVSPEGKPSQIFLDRVDTALALYKANKVSKILVSGDNSTVEYNEVNPIRLYLIENGVADEDIFLDHAGFDTYSTMYRAREIFGVSSIIVTTQSFHVPRAVFIAHKLGIEAYGVSTDRGHILFRNTVREVLANEKAIMDLILHRKPKYLGEKIPISGDGRYNRSL